MNQVVTLIATGALRVHPQNTDYYDDISGEDYGRLKESIQLDGIQAPIIVAADMTIISGHQRYRIAKELNLSQVPVIIRSDIESEDDKLRNLIAANFGRLKNDPAKQRKAIVKYVELVGYKHGGARGQNDHLNTEKLSLDQIAEQLGISNKNLRRLLSIEKNLTDSMKELLDSGVIGETLAADCIASMTNEQQDALLASLDATKRYTKNELKPYIDKIKQLENAELEYSKAKQTISDYKNTTKELQQKLTEAQENADWFKQQYTEAQEQITAISAEKLKPQMDLVDVSANSEYLGHLMYKIQKMLDEDLSPLKFSRLIDTIHKIENDRISLLTVVRKVYAWSMDMFKIIGDETDDVVECISNDIIDCSIK